MLKKPASRVPPRTRLPLASRAPHEAGCPSPQGGIASRRHCVAPSVRTGTRSVSRIARATSSRGTRSSRMRELEAESDNVSLFTDTRFSIDKRKLAAASVAHLAFSPQGRRGCTLEEPGQPAVENYQVNCRRNYQRNFADWKIRRQFPRHFHRQFWHPAKLSLLRTSRCAASRDARVAAAARVDPTGSPKVLVEQAASRLARIGAAIARAIAPAIAARADWAADSRADWAADCLATWTPPVFAWRSSPRCGPRSTPDHPLPTTEETGWGMGGRDLNSRRGE